MWHTQITDIVSTKFGNIMLIFYANELSTLLLYFNIYVYAQYAVKSLLTVLNKWHYFMYTVVTLMTNLL